MNQKIAGTKDGSINGYPFGNPPGVSNPCLGRHQWEKIKSSGDCDHMQCKACDTSVLLEGDYHIDDLGTIISPLTDGHRDYALSCTHAEHGAKHPSDPTLCVSMHSGLNYAESLGAIDPGWSLAQAYGSDGQECFNTLVNTAIRLNRADTTAHIQGQALLELMVAVESMVKRKHGITDDAIDQEKRRQVNQDRVRRWKSN